MMLSSKTVYSGLKMLHNNVGYLQLTHQLRLHLLVLLSTFQAGLLFVALIREGPWVFEVFGFLSLSFFLAVLSRLCPRPWETHSSSVGNWMHAQITLQKPQNRKEEAVKQRNVFNVLFSLMLPKNRLFEVWWTFSCIGLMNTCYRQSLERQMIYVCSRKREETLQSL